MRRAAAGNRLFWGCQRWGRGKHILKGERRSWSDLQAYPDTDDLAGRYSQLYGCRKRFAPQIVEYLLNPLPPPRPWQTMYASGR